MDAYQATLRRLRQIEAQSRRALAAPDPHERTVAIKSINAEKERLALRLRIALKHE